MDDDSILEYFDKYVLGWMCSDIGNCIKAKANLAVAALLMTYSENVGALIEGNLGQVGTSESDFNKFLEHMQFKGDSNYYKEFEIKYKDPNATSIQSVNIYKAFRCGLIHEYGPKVPCVIQNHSDDVDHCTEDDPGIGWYVQASRISYSERSDYVPPGNSITQKGFLMFHTNAYFRDFRRALHSIRSKMGTDRDMMDRMKTSLARVFNRKLIIP
jgi:hypothetical protein